nr:MAG: ParB-like nuclease domain protein [Bacteriophage sp.]
MNIKRIKLADVKPAAYNPRRQLKPGEKEYEALKASISRWSLVEPLVVNLRTGNLVGGHQRYNVLLDLGHTEAEAAVVDLDEKQEKLLNVALNRIEGQWDYEKLQDLFEEFSAEDIFATGYSDGELKTLFGGEDEDPTDLYQDDPEAEEDDDGEDPAAWQDDEEDEEDEDPDFLGASWVVTLTFRSSRDAQRWIDRMGYDTTAKAGKKTTVIRMEE